MSRATVTSGIQFIVRAAADRWLLCSGCGLTIVCLAVLGPAGAVVSALVCSAPFMLLLAGFRWEDDGIRRLKAIVKLPRDRVVQVGRVLLVHSHHANLLRKRGKEFRIGRRHFCTGCYGLLLGTLAGDALAIVHLVHGVEPGFFGTGVWFLPLFFVPIVLRYAWAPRLPAPFRFLANAGLALGCWLILLVGNDLWKSAPINALLLAIVVGIGFWRAGAPARENLRLARELSDPTATHHRFATS